MAPQKKTKRKAKPAPQGKIVMGARDRAGNIIIGDYKRTNALGDMIMYVFIGAITITLLAVATKAYEVIRENQAALPDVTTGATALPSVLKGGSTGQPAPVTSMPVTTAVPLPMQQPDITTGAPQPPVSTAAAVTTSVPRLPVEPTGPASVPAVVTTPPPNEPIATQAPGSGTASATPIASTRLPSIPSLMARAPSSVNYKADKVNNNTGPTKAEVVPGPWKMNAVEVKSVYHLPREVMVSWSVLPISSFSVTVSFRMANPPLVEHNKDFFHVILNTVPFENGLVVAMPGKDHYRISIAGERNLVFRRPQSQWKASDEVLQIRFIQVTPDLTRIETIFNGHESVLKNNAKVPISALRALPSKVEIKDPFKIQNFWVSYAP